MFKMLKNYYDKGLYDKTALKVFVRSGTLTPEQYEDITGETYTK